MATRIARGVLSGLMAGVAFGLVLQFLTVPGPAGERATALSLIAQIVGSRSVLVGWAVHLAISAAIGALFGLFPGRRVEGVVDGLIWGGLYGLAWWLVGGLVLLPFLMGPPALAPEWLQALRSIAMGSLAGHLLYGLVLGAFFDFLRPLPEPPPAVPPRRARPRTQAYMGSE